MARGEILTGSRHAGRSSAAAQISLNDCSPLIRPVFDDAFTHRESGGRADKQLAVRKTLLALL